MVATDTKNINIRLVCKTMLDVPSSEGSLDIGIQDKKQTVHAGEAQKDGSMHFQCGVEARLDESTGGPSFRGSFVQGTPADRFLYLSWKRKSASGPPWFRRVKIPLAGITWKQVESVKANEVLEADITGREPHATQAISWKRGRT